VNVGLLNAITFQELY